MWKDRPVTTGIGGSTAIAELEALVPWSDMAPSIGALEREGRLEKARRLLADSGADALLIGAGASLRYFAGVPWGASERLVAMLLPLVGDPIRSEEHTSELQSLMRISYAVFCLKKK